MKRRSKGVWVVLLTLACCLVGLLPACNDYDYTPVTITMINQSDASVYLWMEGFEGVNAATLVAARKSRTFHQAFTFTEEHPLTHLTIVATKDNDVRGAATVEASADTTRFTVVFKTGEGLTITKKE
jgi:hypothetical protein